jgi:hypothetical protein
MSVRVLSRHPLSRLLSLGSLLALAYGWTARAEPSPEAPETAGTEETGAFEVAEAAPSTAPEVPAAEVAPASGGQAATPPATAPEPVAKTPAAAVPAPAAIAERPVRPTPPSHQATVVPTVEGVIVEPPPAPSAAAPAAPPAAAPTPARLLRPEEVTRRQSEYLQQRFDLAGKTHATVKMSGGRKPVPVGPTARLPSGVNWDQLARMSADEIKKRKVFPYAPLWHPLQEVGGMVFPSVQTGLVPDLERSDVLFDLPDTYLPEFPAPLFITSRPDLGDVSQGQLITLQNADTLFHDILTPTQLEGLKLLLQKTPAQRHNKTDDRSTVHPVAGVACMDCHVNGHTTAQFSLTPDLRPQSERFRVDTASMRGVFGQSWFGSKRALRSLEQFISSEQTSAYFDSDSAALDRKGGRRLSPAEIEAIAQFTRIIDFPPAPKLTAKGMLDRSRATDSEVRGEKIFNQHCAGCHPTPWFTDNLAHDLKVERFYDHQGSSRLGAPGRAEGAVKTTTLRGLKDSPPYLHDGRLLTLEDAVEFFNLVLQTNLNKHQRADLVDYLRTL